jgi:hypothetical protein
MCRRAINLLRPRKSLAARRRAIRLRSTVCGFDSFSREGGPATRKSSAKQAGRHFGLKRPAIGEGGVLAGTKPCYARLFFNGQARFFPRIEAAVQMVNRLKLQFF